MIAATRFIALTLHAGSVFREPCNRAHGSCHFDNVKSGVGPINNIDISTLIGFDIVALYRHFADILSIDFDATLVCCRRNRWDEVANFFRMVRIAYIERTNSCIKPSHKSELSIENWRHALIGRMRAEATSALAKVLAGSGTE